MMVLSLSFCTSIYADTKTYSAEEVHNILKRLEVLEKKVKNQEVVVEEIDSLNERVDDNEFQASMNRIKWGAEFETTVDKVSGQINNSKFNNSNEVSTKLRLSMESKVNDRTKFTGRLSMYKNWSDSTSNVLTDPAQGRKPIGSSSIFVERAYVDYRVTDDLVVTVGRQPSSDGPGMSLIENTKRKSTYPALLFDGGADGIVLSYNVAKTNYNPVIRGAYGKGYQENTEYSPLTINSTEIKDLNVYGLFYEMNIPYNKMGDNLLVISYVHATDFVGHPQYTDAPNNQNLGDMDLYGIYFENNKAFGTKFNYFISLGMNVPDSNGNTVNFGTLTNNQNVSLIKDNGYAFHAGARYDYSKEFKFGYEFNHGSKYWYSFTNGSTDLLNKLATRGNVNDIYMMYQMDMNQFLRIGYTHIDYNYTGSAWHIGKPQETNDYINRVYLTYNLRF